MKKDVIYVDIEDDITSIIEKIKSSSSKIVALVPPKRAGVLQSVVNLKLLRKAAGGVDKHVVLITNDHALMSLAAGVAIPVAKNLQSKPEIAALKSVESEEDDIINGDELPVGELADTAAGNGKKAVKQGQYVVPVAAKKSASTLSPPKVTAAAEKDKKSPFAKKVPNFDKFRKHLFLIIAGAVLLIGLLIWAIFFAPRATVEITARTSLVNVNLPLQLNPDGATEVDENRIKPIVKEVTKSNTVDFDATGKKEVGEKAKGQVIFSNCETPTPQTIESGTTLSANGDNYVLQEDVTVPGGQGSFISGCTNAGESAAASIVASEIGSSSNTSSGTTFSVSGHSSELSASASSSISGGSSRNVTVVSASDVESATNELKNQDDEAVKKELRDQFDPKEVIVISESFEVTAKDPVSEPAVGKEASNARLSAETTYRLVALARSDVTALLDNFLTKQLEGRQDQRVYDRGDGTIRFNEFTSNDDSFSTELQTTSYVGPNINEAQLKPQLVGKNFGEIQQLIEAVEGVENVETKFFPFWVNSAPAADKIDLTFKLQEQEDNESR